MLIFSKLLRICFVKIIYTTHGQDKLKTLLLHKLSKTLANSTSSFNLFIYHD